MEIIKNYEAFINLAWNVTITLTVLLYLLCNLLPDNLTGKLLPLHNVFKPETNIDLDYQSIGYTLLHTTWATRITHSTIIIEAVLWFVIFESWHWSIPFVFLALMVIQSIFIGDRKFGFFFFIIGLLTFGAALFTIKFLGMPQAVLLAKTLLMLGGLMRMLSHSAELIPPVLVDSSDQFVKLTAKNFNLRVLLSSPIGYIGEFGSSLPNRILPVQVNYIYQKVFGFKPQTTLPWNEIKLSAQAVLIGGYSKLNALRKYYESVMKS
ncbi:hypothetical protein [Lacihabitans soyangensis]|uniref:Uncharacterized protein n=1 Tax=Lacihabitans soyangensis TaxID=869394 RepID=A0AAE3H496_9BACT|nr:hypothetical protein [Lacihabitans soyangensis]MCP9764687.1 hypothetical protein [Lacihabitans soyangensis]